jgi:exodeoxyribonuclease-5
MIAEAPFVLPDSEARRRALTEHHQSLLVEAGAGSGKTSLLAGRVALLLANGISPRDIVAITFTEASASELLERIEEYVAALAQKRIPGALEIGLPNGLSDAQTFAIERASREIDEITCTTIHGFCQQLITPYPAEARIDPGAKIAELAAADILYQDILEAWLSERFAHDREDDFFVELVRNGGAEAVHLITAVARFLRVVRTARAPVPEERRGGVAGLRIAINEFVEWYYGCGIIENKTAAHLEELGSIRALLDEIGDQPLTGRNLIALMAHQRPKCCHSKEPRFKKWGNKTAWVNAAKLSGRGKTDGEIYSEQGKERYDFCSEAYRRFVEELASIALERFVVEFDALKERYADRKRQAALLDFDDLLYHARDLLAENEAVRAALALRYPRILVDEFQDTDPLQAEILWRLCGEGAPGESWNERRLREGALFVVGDPKQAIYRFRGADIDTYLAAKHALLRENADAVLEVGANFRSSAPILRFVNERFAPLLDETQGQPGFASLVAMNPSRTDKPAVAVFDIEITDEHKDEKGKVLSSEVRRAEAAFAADIVRRFIGSYPVWDKREGCLRPCRAGDIALLAPTGTHLWVYERELDRCGVPIATQAGKGFFRRQEVQDLIAVARAIADPRDTLAFGALVRGPLAGLSEEEIADAMVALGTTEDGGFVRLTLRTDPAAVVHPVLARTLEILQALARKASRTTPYQLMAEAIEALSVRSIVRARYQNAVERGLANVELFLEMSRAYDVRGFEAFARAMRQKWEDAESQVEGKPDAERDAVALITMHSSKGLEWPIVIPINSMSEIRDRTRFFHRRTDDTVHFRLLDCAGADFDAIKDEEKEQQRRERVRLWYVALTRACELLILPRQSERSENDWMSLIGLELSELPVVADDGGLDGALPERAEAENTQDAATWAEESARITAMRKNIVWKHPSAHEEDAVGDVPAARAGGKRVRGSRERGIVLHKLMEEVLTGETPEAVPALEARARELLAELGLPEADDPCDGINAAELAGCVARGFGLPEIHAVRERLVPEMPVYGAWDGEAGRMLLYGVADALAYEAGGNVEFVVDWKSDVEPDERQVGRYQEQMREYLRATGAGCGMLVLLTDGQIVKIVKGSDGAFCNT